MTPHEKALAAVNARLARLQEDVRDSPGETANPFLVQALIVTIAVGEGLNDYAGQVRQYAQLRHGEVKQVNTGLEAQHAELLRAGQELLARFKANPSDRTLRAQIEEVQRKMAALQKQLRRGTNDLGRDLSAKVALLDPLAESIRRFGEADQPAALKRVLKSVVQHVHGLYARQPGRNIIDAESWQRSAAAEVDQAADFHDAYARAGFQLTLAIELAAMTATGQPPRTAEEATERGNAAVTGRIKAVAARLTGPASPPSGR